MSRRGETSVTRSRTIGEYSIGGQPRKTKFSSPRCDCGLYAIIYQSCTKLNSDRFFLGCPNYNSTQPHCGYFKWLDLLVEENTEVVGGGRNGIFMSRKLKALEHRVMELEMELNMRMKNDGMGVNENMSLRFVIVGLISILLVLALKGLF
ncbi:hypothetical protein PIB30_000607 [Stylosanthes scabra]|uniref:Zinc finger GRF-type domain-containing protein n=1 Tax=Stylosanthes scabra TaxID=79078 RepID=A0ABU6X4B3_9FABA|nr:hypothetical protein [Stylosanthes scabra]